MILLAERCVGTSAVIQDGQSLIGGIDVLVARNYFGSQISSFELPTPPPPGSDGGTFPGVFIRAPAILSVGKGVEVLGRIVATPCRQSAVVLRELERKMAAGEEVVTMKVMDALDRGEGQTVTDADITKCNAFGDVNRNEEKISVEKGSSWIELPSSTDGTDGTSAREVICAARKDNILITAFHPELTGDHRWHLFFGEMVLAASDRN